MKDLLDLHTHTIASGHAYNTLYEMVQAASDKGLSLFGCSDHAPSVPGSCSEMHFINFKVIPRELFGVKVLMGAELNITDSQGHVDLPPRILEKLDYTVASLHIVCMEPGTADENTSAYVNALENPYIQILGHPDDGRYPVDYPRLVAAAKKAHKLLEVNNSSIAPGSFRPQARENYHTMLKLCMEYEQPVIINSDAHIAADVGNHQAAWELLEELHFPQELIVNTSLEKLAGYLPRLHTLLQERWHQ